MAGLGLTSKTFPASLNNDSYTIHLITERSGKNLNVKLYIADGIYGGDSFFYFDMYLQGNTNLSGTGTWETVGSRSGYIADDGWGTAGDSPAFRTFTNIKETMRPMRVYVKLYTVERKYFGFIESSHFLFN